MVFSKKDLFLLVEIPQSSPLAQKLSICMLILIFISVIAFVLEAQPSLYKEKTLWLVVEGFTCFFFTLEYVVRFWVSSRLKSRVSGAQEMVF